MIAVVVDAKAVQSPEKGDVFPKTVLATFIISQTIAMSAARFRFAD